MTSSTPSLLLPGSDVPWLLSRACAGDWPYVPEWKTYLKHPSFSQRFERMSRMFVVPGFEDRATQVAVEIIRKTARKELENREVKHFEVFPVRQNGYRTEPHRACREGGCPVCNGLGVLFVSQAGSHVDLMGWAAIVRVAH